MAARALVGRASVNVYNNAIKNTVLGIDLGTQHLKVVFYDFEALWCDTSTGAECRAIMADYGGERAVLNEVGNLILPGYTASKIRRFRDAQPSAYAQMATILLPHDYLNFYLPPRPPSDR